MGNSQIIVPAPLRITIQIPDTTPAAISQYAQSHEQVLLTKLRYNRVIDLFTGAVCYSIQAGPWVINKNQVRSEIDEIYIGFNRRRSCFVFPLQIKGVRGKFELAQIDQSFALCSRKFPSLICRPIGVKAISDKKIALFEFTKSAKGIAFLEEEHYLLTPIQEMSSEDLQGLRLNVRG